MGVMSLPPRRPHPFVGGLQVVDAEIDVLWIRPDGLGVAVGECVVAGENRAAAREVVPPRRDTITRHAQDGSVEGRRSLNL